MKFTKMITGSNGLSYFEEVDVGVETQQILGSYSKKYPVKDMMFRDFEEGAVFDWHNPDQEQYILYLEGEIEVEASGGDKKIFKPGDVLLAADLTGRGHITRTLMKGRSVIVSVG